MAATFARPMRALPLLLCLLLSACTAELKERANELEDQVLLLQEELAGAELARGALALELADLEIRHTRLGAAARYGFDLSVPVWAVLDTSLGELVCELYPAEAPQTVRSFIDLSLGEKEWWNKATRLHTKRQFYDGSIFHRLGPGKFIQGGSDTGESDFGTGWTIPKEVHPDRKVIPGALAMASVGNYSNGSQFFIAHTALPDLDGLHTVFGGCEPKGTIADLVHVPPENADSERPLNPPRLDRVIIRYGERPQPSDR
jgi:peptidyl-prolyl cis-trans isomerase A (cyclophilin A)